GIAELEISEGEESVRISRHGTAAPQAPIHYAAAPAAAPAPVAAAPVAEAPAAEAPAATPAGHQVLSPMVGTFYRSPSP
ncbi:acetyl-CoA carboxylase biotin carboxyl carrier protein, partial [Escherichia coli]|nr:acetyl-CoA carboxylase biotin carboxyl carrier protein [Escherichia coli]